MDSMRLRRFSVLDKISDKFLSENKLSDILQCFMSSAYPLVETEQFARESQKWLTALKRKENVLVHFFPKTDRLVRIQQILESKRVVQSVFGKSTKILFQIVDFGLHNIEDKKDLHSLIANQLNYTQHIPSLQTFERWADYLQKNQFIVILIIPQIEKLWSVEGQVAQTALHYLIDEYRDTFSLLSFSEEDVTHPSIVPFVSDAMRMYENIYYYSLYPNNDALSFIKYMENKWTLHLKKPVEDRIIHDCGGHFWLLKEAIRQSDADTYPLYPGEGMKFRLKIIYNSLQPSEQQVINKLIRHKDNLTEEEMHSLRYLQKMRLFENNRKCLIELFADYIVTISESSTELTLKNNHLVLNHVPIEKFFSRKEYRVIKVLLENHGDIVSRDTMAKHIWPINTQEQYSDWAIDQLIARVRRRLHQLSLSPKLIQSIRGKGYLLKLS